MHEEGGDHVGEQRHGQPFENVEDRGVGRVQLQPDDHQGDRRDQPDRGDPVAVLTGLLIASDEYYNRALNRFQFGMTAADHIKSFLTALYADAGLVYKYSGVIYPALDWSPDGRYIVSGEGNTQGNMVAKVWVAE